jgi:uncharacterized protein YecE (DUF72 family)
VTEIRIGCSGWNYAHWRERVYPKGLPQKRWLEHYAQLFDTVELNTTFYRLPNVSAVEGWVVQTPPGFVFAVKASRYLTHIRRLTDLEGGIRRFYERIEPLRRSPKLGPVLWQLPPTFKRNDERLTSALEALPEGRHCFEFREPSWYAEEIYALLRAHGAALVIPDSPKYPFRALELTADWTSASIMEAGGGAETTQPGSWRSGRSGSPAGETGASTSTPTSTMTGRASPSRTACTCSAYWDSRPLLRS